MESNAGDPMDLMDLMVTHPKVAAHWAPSQIGRPGGRGAFSRNHRRNGNHPGESWYLMGFEPQKCDLWWVNGFVTTYSPAIEEFAIWKPWPCRCFIVLTNMVIFQCEITAGSTGDWIRTTRDVTNNRWVWCRMIFGLNLQLPQRYDWAFPACSWSFAILRGWAKEKNQTEDMQNCIVNYKLILVIL